MSLEQETTPTLEDLLRDVLTAWRGEIHTSMPGVVQSYDAAKQVADVKPQIKISLPKRDGSTVLESLPIITSVPVLHPRSGNAWVHIPLTAGDTVLLVFCERDINEWRRLAAEVDPGDTRTHQIANAVAIPGLFPATKPISAPDATALEIGIGTMRMKLKPTGLEVGGSVDAPASASKVATELGKIAAALTSVSAGGGVLTGVNTYTVPVNTAMSMIKAGG